MRLALVLTGVLGGIGAPLCAEGKAPLFEDAVTGAIVAAGSAGRWKTIPGVSVTLTCATTEVPSDANHYRSACDSTLRASWGKASAKVSDGVGGVDFEAVGGNSGRVELDLLKVDGEANLIIVRTIKREGDEQMRSTTCEQLYLIDGDKLREVHRYESAHAYDPGPDGPAEERASVKVELAADAGRTAGVPNLVATERDETGGGEAGVTILAWDGARYQPCPSCKPGARQSPAPPDPADLSMIDPATHQSIEPLLAKVLAGERLVPEALAPLSALSLSRLKNAPYARHGRRFKTPDLEAFFYGPRAGESASKVLPLKADPAFRDSVLDASDRKNVETVQAELRRRGGG
jgi:hypothetical protein